MWLNHVAVFRNTCSKKCYGFPQRRCCGFPQQGVAVFRNGILFSGATATVDAILEFRAIPSRKIPSRRIVHVAAFCQPPMRRRALPVKAKTSALRLNDEAEVVEFAKPAGNLRIARPYLLRSGAL